MFKDSNNISCGAQGYSSLENILERMIGNPFNTQYFMIFITNPSAPGQGKRYVYTKLSTFMQHIMLKKRNTLEIVIEKSINDLALLQVLHILKRNKIHYHFNVNGMPSRLCYD